MYKNENESVWKVTDPTGYTRKFGARSKVIVKSENQLDYLEHKRIMDKDTFYKRSCCSHYLFLKHDILSEIHPKTLCKLIFLSTYTGYDGILMKTERQPIYRKDLPKILKISAKSVSQFLEECESIVQVLDNNTLYMDTDIFYRGKLKKTMYNKYTRAYFEGVRSLYNSVGANKHRQLGYIFQMLPYMNRIYNVICVPEDVLETDTKSIRTISFGEFCDLIGYDRSNIKRLKTEYKNIVFPCNDGVTRNFIKTADYDSKIYVNPSIFYAGRDYRQVDVLNTLFT